MANLPSPTQAPLTLKMRRRRRTHRDRIRRAVDKPLADRIRRRDRVIPRGLQRGAAERTWSLPSTSRGWQGRVAVLVVVNCTVRL